MAKKKDYIIFIIIIAFIAIFILYLNNPTRDYHSIGDSSYSAKDAGNKGFYLSLKEYGRETKLFKADTYNKYARYIPDNTINIMVHPNYILLLEDIEIKAIRGKIESGVSFVFFIDRESLPMLSEFIDAYSLKEQDTYNEYLGPKGKLITYFVEDDLNNLSLKTENTYGAHAIVFLGELAKELGIKKILVNEYYHTGKSADKAVDYLGYGPVLFIIQMAISLILWALYKGIRFGRPEVAYETIKRDELENVHALKNMYKKSNSSRIAFDVHMEALLSDLRRKGNISGYENEDVYEYIKEDKEIMSLVEIYEGKKNIGKIGLKNLINKIEAIRKEL